MHVEGDPFCGVHNAGSVCLCLCVREYLNAPPIHSLYGVVFLNFLFFYIFKIRTSETLRNCGIVRPSVKLSSSVRRGIGTNKTASFISILLFYFYCVILCFDRILWQL